MKTAFFSAYDKAEILDVAQDLSEAGWDIFASGGTARHLNEGGVTARDIAEIVGEPILGHRVVTLSREVHAALLATDSSEDQKELDRIGIPRIDFVYVNFYPLAAEIADPDHTLESVIGKTDIGGPTMIRSACKGRRIVACTREMLDLATELALGRCSVAEEESVRQRLIARALGEVSRYCLIEANFHLTL